MEIYFLRDILTYAAILLAVVYFFFSFCYNYWRDRNFPYITPRIPLGNNKTFLCKFPGPNLECFDHYQEIRKMGHRFAGIFSIVRPILLIADPELANDILVKDFDHFVDRGFYKTPSDPLSVHLFSMDAAQWRRTRIKMTPTFTSGKIKMMISSVLSVSESMMEEIFDISMKKSDMDIKEVTTKFTVNSMAICILGIEPGTERSDIFLSEAQKHFDTASFMDLLRLSVMNRFPDLSNKFGMKLLRKEVEVFFKNIISDCVRYREENNYTRPDFLELMMNLVNETKHTSNPFDNDRMNAEIFDFFLASLDTSSSTISYTLFELAKHPEIQERVRSEMNKVLGRHSGKIDSNCLNEIKYLHQIIDETLRLYPPLPNLERKCVKDYKIDGTDLIIEKGTSIFIPVLGFHRDPEYYPDPEKFDPERFSDENKGNKSKIFLSFGSGPRSCIGLRFGYMLVRVALVKILMEYRVTVSESTKLPLEMDKHTLMLTLKNPILLKAEKI